MARLQRGGDRHTKVGRREDRIEYEEEDLIRVDENPNMDESGEKVAEQKTKWELSARGVLALFSGVFMLLFIVFGLRIYGETTQQANMKTIEVSLEKSRKSVSKSLDEKFEQQMTAEGDISARNESQASYKRVSLSSSFERSYSREQHSISMSKSEAKERATQNTSFDYGNDKFIFENGKIAFTITNFSTSVYKHDVAGKMLWLHFKITNTGKGTISADDVWNSEAMLFLDENKKVLNRDAKLISPMKFNYSDGYEDKTWFDNATRTLKPGESSDWQFAYRYPNNKEHYLIYFNSYGEKVGYQSWTYNGTLMD